MGDSAGTNETNETNSEPGRWARWQGALGVAGAALLSLAVWRGCGVRTDRYVPPDGELSKGRAEENPWPAVVADLRRDNSLKGAREALDRLKTALLRETRPEFQPDALTADEAKTLRAALRLSDADLAEVRGSGSTGLDAFHLAETFYLRDAARGLDVGGRPVAEQARAALGFVSRLVLDKPWAAPDGRGNVQLLPPAPAGAVLTRGFGSGQERAGVVIALLTQLGHDAVWVGPPEAAERPWSYSPTPAPGVSPAGPMWAVAVRDGDKLLLLDPWRGEVVPGGAPNGIATLAEVRANPALLKPWRDDKARPFETPEAHIKESRAYLAVTLSSVAPRLRRLEQELKAESPPARLTADVPALAARLTPLNFGAPVAAWNPPNEPFTFVRSLAGYVPKREGGASPVDDLPGRNLAAQAPAALFGALPAGIGPSPGDPGVPEVAQQLRTAALGNYGAAFLSPPTPREGLARGQFAEVSRALVAKNQGYLAARSRLRGDKDRDAAVARFAEGAREVYSKLLRARDREPNGGPLTLAATQEVAQFVKSEAPTTGALIDQIVAEPGAAESTYLLALCWHEQAERSQARLERGPTPAARERARTDWSQAGEWWGRYEPYAEGQDQFFKGRAAQSKQLAERARRLAQPGGN